MKCIVSLGWSVWTCNSKTMQVYSDSGSLLGSQEEAADLAHQLAAAEGRETALKAALLSEQSGRQAEAKQAAVRHAEAADAAKQAQDQVTCRQANESQCMASLETCPAGSNLAAFTSCVLLKPTPNLHFRVGLHLQVLIYVGVRHNVCRPHAHV